MQQLTPAELASWLNDPSREPPVLLDVREAWEHERVIIDGSVPLPMSQIVARLSELEPNRDCVTICHHGMRSMQVAMFLERSGFPRVYNLQGGIDAWAREVDPRLPRY